jgi:hypothetical protein
MTIATVTIEEGPIDSGRLSYCVIPDGLSLDWAEQQFGDQVSIEALNMSAKLIQHVSQMAVRIALEKKRTENKVEGTEW